jgi:hypothetical protein
VSKHEVGQYVQGFTAVPFAAIAAGNTTNASNSGEWMRAIAPVAPRQPDADDSTATAWVMIGTILCTLAVMLAVVIATATSMS